MPFFQKKPDVIEARQLTHANIHEIFVWINSNYNSCYRVKSVFQPLEIETIKGRHLATIGDWIIKDVEGEFYPCGPQTFEMTYQPMIKNNG